MYATDRQTDRQTGHWVSNRDNRLQIIIVMHIE